MRPFFFAVANRLGVALGAVLRMPVRRYNRLGSDASGVRSEGSVDRGLVFHKVQVFIGGLRSSHAQQAALRDGDGASEGVEVVRRDQAGQVGAHGSGRLVGQAKHEDAAMAAGRI